MNPRTEQNLLAAMKDDAFTYAKYLLFAEQARRNGKPVLAELFEKIAHTKLHKHFAQEATFARLVRSDSDNLSEALQGESGEIDHTYRRYARQAEADGDLAVAQLFDELRNDEIGHREAFTGALRELSLAAW